MLLHENNAGEIDICLFPQCKLQEMGYDQEMRYSRADTAAGTSRAALSHCAQPQLDAGAKLLTNRPAPRYFSAKADALLFEQPVQAYFQSIVRYTICTKFGSSGHHDALLESMYSQALYVTPSRHLMLLPSST